MFRGTQDTGQRHKTFAYGTFTLYGRLFQYRSANLVLGNFVEHSNLLLPVLQPLCYSELDLLRRQRFRLIRVRSPLLTESFLLSFIPGTKMFQFPDFARICVLRVT